MRAYQAYFNRQTPSAETHEKILAQAIESKPSPWGKWAAAAVCCALLLGVGAVVFSAMSSPMGRVEDLPPAVSSAGEQSRNEPLPGEAPVPEAPVPEAPAPALVIHYPPETGAVMGDIALPRGSFFVNFSYPETAPEAEPLLEKFTALFPGYDISCSGAYGGDGDLLFLYVYGTMGTESFSLELSPGQLPPSCCGRPEQEKPTVIDGVEVYGWSAKYDRNGDGREDCYCGSEFLAGKYGIRFENTGAPYRSAYNGMADREMGGAMEFNARFVEWVLNGGLDEDVAVLLHTDEIPSWETRTFTTLEDARQETEFAAYLPETAPVDWPEFFSTMEFQSGHHKWLFVSWNSGLSSLEVQVLLPESGSSNTVPVDVNVPESYDLRLYEIPHADTVPEEYYSTVMYPAFRAEDMSPEVLSAREEEADGMTRYCFTVLFPGDRCVQYSAKGLTAEQMWALISETEAFRSLGED